MILGSRTPAATAPLHSADLCPVCTRRAAHPQCGAPHRGLPSFLCLWGPHPPSRHPPSHPGLDHKMCLPTTPSLRHLRYHLGQHGFPLVSLQECPEERPLRPAGPPLSAQPSRPCSTRLQGTVFWGGSSCTHSGLGPATAPPCWDQAPRGQACPFLPSPSAHKEGEGGKEAQTNRTWGLCTLGRGGSLVSRTETASLGPSGKKGPG